MHSHEKHISQAHILNHSSLSVKEKSFSISDINGEEDVDIDDDDDDDAIFPTNDYRKISISMRYVALVCACPQMPHRACPAIISDGTIEWHSNSRNLGLAPF